MLNITDNETIGNLQIFPSGDYKNVAKFFNDDDDDLIFEFANFFSRTIRVLMLIH